MPVYAYKGLNERGKEVKGLLDADSPRVLRSLLKKQGVRIVEHREEDQSKKSEGLFSATSTEIDLGRFFERVSVADVALVTRQLATLLRSGIPLSAGAPRPRRRHPSRRRAVARGPTGARSFREPERRHDR